MKITARPFSLSPIPRRVVCLTEESVETLYLLGLEDHIVGVSAYVKRPAAAMKKKRVTAFVKANVRAIVELKPDLVLGYSDIQKEIARDLVGHGLSVWIANHRRLEDILSYVQQLANLFQKQKEGARLVEKLLRAAEGARKRARRLLSRPRVYFEEWDEPQISAITWVSEMIELAGGRDIFENLRGEPLATGRIVSRDSVKALRPDIIFSCWCGKRMKRSSFDERFAEVPAVKTGWVRELEPEIFLQPGPAPFLDGLRILSDTYAEWALSACARSPAR
jgi:iron complex transport system substrate-binding protein